MRIGALRNQVSIQQLAGTQDSIGQPVPTWIPLATGVWANIRYLKGVEAIKAGAETSMTKVSIRIRYRTDVTAAMRVLHGTTLYAIKTVLPDQEGRQHVDLVCEVLA